MPPTSPTAGPSSIATPSIKEVRVSIATSHFMAAALSEPRLFLYRQQERKSARVPIPAQERKSARVPIPAQERKSARVPIPAHSAALITAASWGGTALTGDRVS